jgi:DNA-directed RNA polymerase subunit beta
MANKFEDKLFRLNEIVKKMESENLPLDESVKLYEEAMKLSKELEEELKAAKAKVQLVEEDGSRVDIVLTPLGIPSRMNIGQVFETLLGWAGEKLGCKYATPIFSGFDLDSINGELNKAGIPDCAEVQLYDGLTGEKFEQKSTVGMIYMIKLNHMVADKVHARSIGQYSVITQQPLSGRAHFGGQRFGEMEVWSLEAYGAANLLQEMLTIKSDDIIGRKMAYESLLNGEPVYNSNIPESFHVLMKELTAIGLRITFSN